MYPILSLWSVYDFSIFKLLQQKSAVRIFVFFNLELPTMFFDIHTQLVINIFRFF